MPYFDLPDENNQTLVNLIQWNNSVTEGLFGLIVLITIFGIVYLRSNVTLPPEKSFAAASLISAVSSYFFFILGIVSNYIILVFTVMAVSSLLLIRRQT